MSQKLVFTPPNDYQHESEKLSAPYCECSGTSLIALYPYKLLNMSYEFNNSNNGSLPFATYWGGRNTPSTKIILTNVCCDIGDKLDASSYMGGGRYIECYGYSTKYYWIYVSLKKSGDDDNKVYYIVGRYLISDIPNHEINERLDVSDQNIVLTTELWPNYCYRGAGNKTFQSIAFPEYIVKNSRFINLRGLHNFYNRQHALDDIAYLKRSDLTSNNVLVLTKSQVEEYNLLTSTSTVSDSQLQTVSANKLQGKVPLASMPVAALERVHNVADETARFALTTATVQNGDVVHQQDDHSQYYVVDDTKLNNAAGYKKITKVALEVPWTGLTDKPVYFQPTSHSHGNITNDGYLGETANLPLITGSNGTIIAGSFGNLANTFCEGNDSRLSDAREPLNHGSNKVTALTGYVAGGVSTSPQSSNLGGVSYRYWYPSSDLYGKATYMVNNKHTLINPYALYVLGANSYENYYYTNPSWSAIQHHENSNNFQVYVASNIKIDVGQEFPGYGASYGTGNRTLVHNGFSTDYFWVYRTDAYQIITDVWGPYSIADVNTYKDFTPDSSSLPSQHKIDVSSYNDSYVQTYIERPDPRQVANVVTKVYVEPLSGPISSEDTLNQALGKIEFRVADYKDSLSMSSYSVQAKAVVTTSDTIQTAIGKIEGGYLARKYATADDIDVVLFNIVVGDTAKFIDMFRRAQQVSTILNPDDGSSNKSSPVMTVTANSANFSEETIDWTSEDVVTVLETAGWTTDVHFKILKKELSNEGLAYALAINSYEYGSKFRYITSPCLSVLLYMYENNYISRLVVPMTVGNTFADVYMSTTNNLVSNKLVFILPETGHYLELNGDNGKNDYSYFRCFDEDAPSSDLTVLDNGNAAPYAKQNANVGRGNSGCFHVITIDNTSVATVAITEFNNRKSEVSIKSGNCSGTEAYGVANRFTGDPTTLVRFLRDTYGNLNVWN